LVVESEEAEVLDVLDAALSVLPFVVLAGVEGLFELSPSGDPFRLSVTYQPLPLKTIAGGVSTRRAVPEHSGQTWTEGASKPSRFS
jgi:hypothetical protein